MLMRLSSPGTPCSGRCHGTYTQPVSRGEEEIFCSQRLWWIRCVSTCPVLCLFCHLLRQLQFTVPLWNWADVEVWWEARSLLEQLMFSTLRGWPVPAPYWPKATITNVCSLGILCGTLAAKKKKKMMYLTAKNAGQKIPVFLDYEMELFYFFPIADFKMCLNRVWPTRVTDIRGSGQSPSIPEEDASPDRRSGRGSTQPKEPADGPPSHTLRHYNTMYPMLGFYLFIYFSLNSALTENCLLFFFC